MLKRRRKLYKMGVLGGGVTVSQAFLFSDDFNRADGALGGDWVFNTGVWTIAGNQAVATPSLGSEMLTNGSMESGDPPTGWSANGGATLSSVADERTGGAGSAAMNAVRGTNDVTARQLKIASDEFVRYTAWLKNNDATSLSIKGVLQEVDSASTSWTQVVYTEYFDINKYYELRVNGTTGQQGRFDDASLKPVDLSDALAVQDFGVSNVSVSVDLTLDAVTAGIALCVDDQSNPQNYVLVFIVANYCYIIKCVSGTVTVLRKQYSGVPDFSSATTLTAQYLDGAVRVLFDGVQWFDDVIADDAGIISNTSHGIVSTDATVVIDNFAAVGLKSVAIDGDAGAYLQVDTAAANLWTSSGSDDHLARPVLCDDGTNWIAIYRSATEHTYLGAGKFHIRFSTDEGATWTAEDTFTDAGAVTGAPFSVHGSSTDVSDAIIFKAPNGDLLIHAYEGGDIATHGTYQYRSTDGGDTWSDEGLIDGGYAVGGQDYVVVGSDIYITVMYDADQVRGHSGANPWDLRVYKSSNNGTSWSDLGAVDSGFDGNESGIAYVDTDTFVIVSRDSSGATTYTYTSTDACSTWSARAEMPAFMGVLARPRFYATANGWLLYGRDELGTFDRAVVYYTPDGVNYAKKFYPDAGDTFADTGYCDLLEKADGSYYMLNYGGSTAAAVIRDMEFSIGT